jgi:large subunit ribosomal protein L25
VHISQVKLPEGVVPANQDEDFTVATIVAPSAMKAEEEETAPEGEVPTVGEGEEGAGEGGEAAEGESKSEE